MRWVAKNVAAAGLADRCEAQVAYAIGKAMPVGLFIECFGTEKVPVERIQDAVLEVFDLRPRAIIYALDLLRPIYAQTAAYGHFGRTEPDFSLGSDRPGRPLATPSAPDRRTRSKNPFRPCGVAHPGGLLPQLLHVARGYPCLTRRFPMIAKDLVLPEVPNP